MSGIAEFNKLIGQRIKELIPVQTFWVVSKSIDWDKKQMLAVGQSDSLEYEVSLGSGSVFRKPSINTICLVGIKENNGATAFLIDADEIDEYLISDKTGFKVSLNADGLTLNGDAFGGIVKATELKTQIDKNTEILKAIQQAFQTWVAVPNDGGAALKTLASSFTGLPTAELGNIKNDKIKHG